MSSLPPEGSPERFGRFFLPGPTEVRPDVLQAQVRPMIGHRGPGIQDLMKEIQRGLKQVFVTERPVFVAGASATGFMEAAVRNGAKGRVLALVNGAFSQRFADIARACALDVDELAVPWGEVHDPAAVATQLQERHYDAVAVVHSETSTGALNDLSALSAVVAESEGTFLLVDSVTGVGGAEMRADDWQLDFVLTGSQKALALPPGLAFGVASDRMMERAAQMEGKGVYFDLVAFAKNLDNFQTPTTPALSLLYALQHQLVHIQEETMEGRWARHMEMAERTWDWVDDMRGRGAGGGGGTELSVMAPEGARSPTVTTICLPDHLKGPAIVKGMFDRGWVIGGGYGKLKEGTIRIGHMGDHTLAELNELLGVLEEVMA